LNLNSLILTHQRPGVIGERQWDNFGNASLPNIERELLCLFIGANPKQGYT
jgi:hypothetical protein